MKSGPDLSEHHSNKTAFLQNRTCFFERWHGYVSFFSFLNKIRCLVNSIISEHWAVKLIAPSHCKG